MLAQKVNAKNIHSAINATIDPFEALEQMPDTLEPRTPFPGAAGIPFDAEILYARKATESKTHPEISRLEVKFQKNITGFLYQTKRGNVALQCEDMKDGLKSVLQTGVSFEALLTLPNLREQPKVVPIPDTSQYVVTDDPKKPGYIVSPEKNNCGCQIIFQHDYECRHLKAVREYQAENVETFQKKTPSDFPPPENAPEMPVAESKVTSEGKPPEVTEETLPLAPDAVLSRRAEGVGALQPIAPLSRMKPDDWRFAGLTARETFRVDVMGDTVAKHHPASLAAMDTNEAQESVYCAVCNRELTNPTSRRAQLGPVCREKVGVLGEAHLRENVVSEKLLCASRKYKDVKFQNWILHGCLHLDAPVPKTVIPQKKTEYWGLKRAPSLYYLCQNMKLHCIYKVGKEFKYQRISATSRENELHQMAWREAKEEYIDNGGKKRRTILL